MYRKVHSTPYLAVRVLKKESMGLDQMVEDGEMTEEEAEEYARNLEIDRLVDLGRE
jgi:polyhydroxyalkanoate synthesis regulator phasin